MFENEIFFSDQFSINCVNEFYLIVNNYCVQADEYIDLTQLQLKKVSENIFSLESVQEGSVKFTDPFFLESKNNLDTICQLLRNSVT